MGETTVLLRRSSLGDVVLLGAVTPSLDGEVVVVTDERWAPVGRRLRGVDRVLPWPASSDALPAGRLVDLQASRRSRKLIGQRGGARVRKHGLRRRARLLAPWIPRRPAVPELYAKACGVAVAPLPWIEIERVPEDLLVLVPGAAWATKQWKPAEFIRLGRRWPGEVAVLGGPGEEALCDGLVGAIEGAYAHAGRGFERAFELFSRASAVVGGDTGLLHLAGACGVPVVMLFGPTDPDDGFFVYPGKAVHRTLACRPCSLHGANRCPLVVQRCMDIPAERVHAALDELLCVG